MWCVCVYIYIYIHAQRERERERMEYYWAITKDETLPFAATGHYAKWTSQTNKNKWCMMQLTCEI